MKRKFIINLILVVFLNLLVKPFWVFGIDRTVQNVVGAEQYGFYFALFNFSLILNILLDLGITNYNNRHISQNESSIGVYFSNILSLRLILGAFYLAVSMAAAWLLNYNAAQMRMLLFLTFNQFLLALILYFRSNIAGLQMFKTDSIVSVLDRFVLILICSLLLWGNITDTPFRIEWFVYAQTGSYLFTAAVAFVLVLVNSGGFRLRFDYKFSLEILKKSYPFALLTLLMSLYNRIDSVMLERLLPDGKVQAGIYAQAFRISDACCMFALLFANLLLPMFSRMLKQGENVAGLLKLSTVTMAVPVTAGALTCVFYRQQVMDLMYNSHTAASAPVFALLISGFVAISMTYIYGTLLTANGSLRHLNMVAFGGMVFNIVGNLVAIPRFGALGAAVVSLATQSLTAIAQIAIAFSIFGLKFCGRTQFKLAAYVLIVTAVGFVTTHMPFGWAVNAAVMLIAAGVVSLVLGFFRAKDFVKLLKIKDEPGNR
ncbi:MAG: oligosaccharide flippase family protein [Salinivirgaceae bacterium]|nr:oligosaccharide flippase family protein [Salinivirgaceae bacterium]